MHLDGVFAASMHNASPSKVRRTELLLTGNRLSSLLDSFIAWSQSRLGVLGHGIYVPSDEGELVLISSVGAFDQERANLLLSSGQLKTERTVSSPFVVKALFDANTFLGVLVTQQGHTELSSGDYRALDRATELLAHRLPSALELERLSLAMEKLAEAERLQRALYMISDLANGEREMDEVLAAIHRIIAELMYAENFYIALYDADSDVLRLPYFRDAMDFDAPIIDPFPASDWEGSLTLHALRTGKTLMGPSIELLADNGLDPGGFGPQSEAWLGVPMLRGNEVTGILVVQSYDQNRRYSEKDRVLLNYVAQHVGAALERLRTHEELDNRVRQRTEELNSLNLALRAEIRERERAQKLQLVQFQIAELGSTLGSVEAFFQALHRTIAELIVVRNFYIALLSADGTRLDFPYSVDEHDRVRQSRQLGYGLTEYVLRTGRPLLASREVQLEMERRGELHVHGARSTIWLGVPLMFEGAVMGVMATQVYDDRQAYTQVDQDLLTFVSYHIVNALHRKQQADSLREANALLEQRVSERTAALAMINNELRNQISEREMAEGRLRHAALHDALTGLPNRSLLLDAIGDALIKYRSDNTLQFAVLFLDLDRFKLVNDSVGHLVGDELLKAASHRILAQLDEQATLARLGGDEFAILLDVQHSTSYAPEVASRIIEAMESPLRIGGKEIYSSTSIGITYSQPHYLTAEELLRDADVALYRAKANGRRRYEVFDEALRSEAIQQLELEGNLRRALVRREFEPVFQPIFNLEDNEVVGYEALLRWRHPQLGVISPVEFLNQAEESGLAEEIDWQVFDIAFAQSQQILGADRYLSINVGARHLRSPNFVQHLLQRLDLVGFNPAQLQIEVTERVLLEDPLQSRFVMEDLGSHGISVALDDFGTGYSSLSYLHQFPLQTLKIDQSFISPLDGENPGNSYTVLRAIHALGTELGLQMVAEGIETESQLELVNSLGGIYGQGFLLSRPGSVHTLIAAGLTSRH